MGDFFGFNTEIPSNINVLGRHTLEEELLTDEVEDEYDALNDETFGHAANDDWEEAHEKLSELIKQNHSTSTFGDSILEHDDNSQNEIVSQSISQLGLEDDLDDPAIMTISRNCHSLRHSGSVFGSSSSPPPPAFLDTEDCGSPKTHSIWSTTPKDSGITSFLQSIGQGPNRFSLNSPTPFNSSSDNVFTTPPKAWRAEELERDLLSNEPTTQQQCKGRNWPTVPNVNMSNQNNISLSPPKLSSVGQFQHKINTDHMMTREEVERQMLSDVRHFPPNIQNSFGNPRMRPPMMTQNLISPIGSPRPTPLNVPNHSSPAMPLRPVRDALLGNNCPLPDPYLFMKAQMSSLMHNRMPLRGPPMPNLPPGFPPSNMNLNHRLINFPSRSIPHPYLNKHFQFPVINHNRYENEDIQNSLHEDGYAGLMTQREKDWLARIQTLLLKTDNPYVEDYYFTTQVARRCQKKYSESANKGAGDAPELILPQTIKHENKTYVPTQFEGSLGKLQAVSVNFPRKVLDITVPKTSEDEEGRVVTNQCISKYRRLLMNIENMYKNLLEIEDEERRILAKPASDGGPHRMNIDKYTQNIYKGLISDGCEDNFHLILTVRKGRSLLMRVFKIFNPEQQLHCLIKFLNCLPVVLKKDQNDHILLHNIDVILDLIERLDNLSYMVQLMEALDKDLFVEEHTSKMEKNSLANILKYKFGSSVICKILMRAEELYSSLNSVATDIHTKWSKIVLSLVNCLCLLPNTAISPSGISCVNLLGIIQRFDVDNEKLSVLKEKLAILNNQYQNGVSDKTV